MKWILGKQKQLMLRLDNGCFVLACVFRFLRHVPVVYVDYPGQASLTQIYGTFNRAMLRLIPSLRTYAEPLTAAMVEFYIMSQVEDMRKRYEWWNYFPYSPYSHLY